MTSDGDAAAEVERHSPLWVVSPNCTDVAAAALLRLIQIEVQR